MARGDDRSGHPQSTEGSRCERIFMLDVTYKAKKGKEGRAEEGQKTEEILMPIDAPVSDTSRAKMHASPSREAAEHQLREMLEQAAQNTQERPNKR
jgi:hypothetical protein